MKLTQEDIEKYATEEEKKILKEDFMNDMTNRLSRLESTMDKLLTTLQRRLTNFDIEKNSQKKGWEWFK